MFEKNLCYFLSRPTELEPVTLLLDNGYHKEKILLELARVHSELPKKVRIEISPKMSKKQKKAQGLSGFVPAAKRWVVERSNSWVERCKSLIKNFERNLFRANEKLKLCFIRLLVKFLAR